MKKKNDPKEDNVMGNEVNVGDVLETKLMHCGFALDGNECVVSLFGTQECPGGPIELYFYDELGVHYYFLEDIPVDVCEDDGDGARPVNYATDLSKLSAGMLSVVVRCDNASLTISDDGLVVVEDSLNNQKSEYGCVWPDDIDESEQVFKDVVTLSSNY